MATALMSASHASAQASGTASRPAPNVLLLVDTSGSMERMADNSLPSANRGVVVAPFNACQPGVESNPNRWSMLVQALTGSLNPASSCWEMPRGANPATGPGSAFRNQYKIAGTLPYDTDYSLPFHRLLSGPLSDPCVLMPNKLPGASAGSGVGPAAAGGGGGNAEDFPDDAIVGVKYSVLRAALESDTPVNTSIPSNLCRFDQASDGQLDLARDFARFGLLTFDNDENAGIGVSTSTPPGGSVSLPNPFTGQWSYAGPSVPSGFVPGCGAPFVWELGARHRAAPPWEGRHVLFPSANADLFEMHRVNEQLQQVLLTTRPYGATPLDGMFTDAEHYLRNGTSLGPNGTTNSDPYVKNGCRDQYIVLMSDGAPNLDLRPQCTGPGGTCPFQTSSQIADAMYQGNAATGQHVKTFVIGFSVNGAGDIAYTNDGFPVSLIAPNNNCRGWFQTFGPDDQTRTTAMNTFCGTTPPPKGSTADACCKLNDIAYMGSGGGTGSGTRVPPFFAETQRDLLLAFGRILAMVAKTASTRTSPAYSPTITTTVPATVQGNFVASFVPNAQKPWSGELDRRRVSCVGQAVTPIAHTPAEGDSYSTNTEAQTRAKRRFFITVKPDPTPNAAVLDSAGTIRPFTSITPQVDGILDYKGAELAGLQTAETQFSALLTPSAFEIDDTSCKRSKTPQDTLIPPLAAAECSSVAWNFMSAWPESMTYGGHDFNARCNPGALGKRCSVSNNACTVDTDCASGEVCVPPCAALGGIFRSSPVVVGPPASIVRDDGYRGYEAARTAPTTRRRSALFVASTDGILHAFDALGTVNGPGANGSVGVGSHRTNNNEFEFWAFVPPAILPKLASNVPSGQQILLDGTVATKDVVWDRLPGVTDKNAWHSTLVAGLGTNGGGYYALNVSDVDCGGDTKFCGNAGSYQSPTPNAMLDVSTGADTSNGSKAGPHFLWQLTDVPEKVGSEKAKRIRKDRDLPGRDRVALFAQRTGTPAITTLYFDPSTVSPTGPGAAPREIGIAILPGGIENAPSPTATCARDPRAVGGGSNDRSDPAYPPRANVRQWGKTSGSCANSTAEPVPGRSLTFVRVDTGEIIRHFGREAQDVPQNLVGLSPRVVTDAPFDSPIIGTPSVFPAQVGSLGRKVFVGDADGTIWRINVASTNPNEWRVDLFQDLYSPALPAGPGALDGRPVGPPLNISTDTSGLLVINAATGDQENITYSSTAQHYVYSLLEQRAVTAQGQYGKVSWFHRFETGGQNTGERVTGPMAVFDKKLYFATYRPLDPSTYNNTQCGTGNESWIWGVNYLTQRTSGDPSQGGVYELCNDTVSNDPFTSPPPAPVCSTVQKKNVSAEVNNALIPGVSILAQPTCSALQTDTDYAGSGYSFGQQTSTSFKLFFGAGGSGGTAFPGVRTGAMSLSTPKTPTTVDAWALVIE